MEPFIIIQSDQAETNNLSDLCTLQPRVPRNSQLKYYLQRMMELISTFDQARGCLLYICELGISGYWFPSKKV